MKAYKSFIFESYGFDPASGRIELTYSLDGEVTFVETVTAGKTDMSKVDSAALERALFGLHLIGGASYYKTCCPKQIIVKSGKLTEEQALFWHDVYEKGLGEFFYKNKIDFRGLIKFPVDPEAPAPLPATRNPQPATNPLVPIGGGKDSMVTIELLRSAGIDVTLFRMGGHPIIESLAKEAELPLLTVERSLPASLFKLNEEGALNGHVPITGFLSFLGVVVSLLRGHDAFILSNERSANEGNVLYHGVEINHQWSKSAEFEKAFSDYLRRYVTPDVRVFSLLRPLSELHIAQLCAAFPQYLPLVTSCNANWKILKEKSAKKWCGVCPKCAFSFCLFSAFLDKRELVRMFGSNFYEDVELLPLYRELLGLAGFKPFECVGTPEETRAAFRMALDQREFSLTPAMKMYQKEVTSKPTDDDIKALLKPAKDHLIPDAYLPALHAAA